MDNISEGTTMSAGIVSPIGGFGKSNSVIASPEGARSQAPNGAWKQSQTEPTNISEFRANKTRSEPVSSSEDVIIRENPLPIPRPLAPERSDGERGENQSYADTLFDVAKKDGIDAAFEKLAIEPEEAKVEIEKVKRENDSDVMEDSGSIRDKQVDAIIDSEIPELIENDKVAEPAITPIEQKVLDLETQINQMVEENKNLAKKADEAHEMARMGVATALQLAQVLKELIEMEEEEKKKKKNQSLLEILARLIAQMLIMVTVPEDQQKEIIDEMNEKAA